MTSVLDQNFGSESEDENFNPAPADDSENEAPDGSDAEVNVKQGARQRRASSLGSNDSAESPAHNPDRRKKNGIVSNGAGLGEDEEDDGDANGSVRDEDEEDEDDDDDDDDEDAVTVFYFLRSQPVQPPNKRCRAVHERGFVETHETNI